MNALLCFSDKIIIKKFLYLTKIKKYKYKNIKIKKKYF